MRIIAITLPCPALCLLFRISLAAVLHAVLLTIWKASRIMRTERRTCAQHYSLSCNGACSMARTCGQSRWTRALAVDEREIPALGVKMASWIAIPIAYLDHLCDRDVSYRLLTGDVFVVLNVPRFSGRQRLIACFMDHQISAWKCRFYYVRIVMLARPR